MADFISQGGLGIISLRIKGSSSEPLFIGWATGAGTAAASDTALFTEAASQEVSGPNNVRVTGTSSNTTTNFTNDTYEVTGTVTAAGTLTITNAGLFLTNGAQTSPAAPSGGTLYCHSNFTGIPLNNNDTISFTFSSIIT